ncbi:hypothetical protein L9F63_026889, partial [Diploptera punctata]
TYGDQAVDRSTVSLVKRLMAERACCIEPRFCFLSESSAGGGTFLVLPINNGTGRLDFNASRVTGHRGPVLDIKWNPFNDNIIASCSDDCT